MTIPTYVKLMTSQRDNGYRTRDNFRKSEEWKNFRQYKYDEQNGLDYITYEPLRENWNCHHLRLDHARYTDISDPRNFVALNKETHNRIHALFIQDWKNIELNDRERKVLEMMEELNRDNIEPLLFSCHIEYGFDHTDKMVTTVMARELNLATDSYGMIYWNPNTRNQPDPNQPVDSLEWLKYQSVKNKWNRTQMMNGMQLRHLCLYSSMKNIIRPEVKAKWNVYKYKETKRNLEQELKNTTVLIRKMWEIINK